MTEEFYFRSVSKHGNQKLRRIRAETFELAKEKAIEKFSHILYFKQKMDLQTALKRASEASAKTKKPYYISVETSGENEGECTINTAPLGEVTHKFVNGIEDKIFKPKNNGIEATHLVIDEALEIPKSKIKVQKNKKIKMSTTKTAPKKATPAKKVVPAKKSAAKPAKVAKVKSTGPKKMYGMGILLVEAIKKAPLTMEQLVKKFEQSKANVSYHLSSARANGFKVELTEKGYKIK